MSKSSCNGVVFEHISGKEVISDLGKANDRSFCHNREQESASVLLLDSSSGGLCNGCPVSCMAEHVCLCISPSPINSQSIEPLSAVSVLNDTDSPNVAKTTLVSTNSEISNSVSCKSPVPSGSVISVQGENDASKCRVSTSDCMAIIDRKFSSTGFSEKTRQLLSKSWRKRTQKDYRSKFRQFNSWCVEHKIDTYSASLVNCAEFLTFLYEKGLKYRTMNGYRSMLSSVLAPVGNIPVGQHCHIIRLLKGIFNERPPLKRLVLEWDLLVILDCLKEKPFEPLKDASLKFLTWKTCFLVAITTFRRCSDLQALQLGEGLVNVYTNRFVKV